MILVKYSRGVRMRREVSSVDDEKYVLIIIKSAHHTILLIDCEHWQE